MRYVGMGEDGKEVTFDARREETMNSRIYEFVLKHMDYMSKFNPVWETILAEYIFDIGGYKFILPSATYVFCADPAGPIDWIVTDELIGRDIDIFLMNLGLQSWSNDVAKLVDTTKTILYMPSTKNIIPVSDMSGTKVILIAYQDKHKDMGDVDFGDFLVM